MKDINQVVQANRIIYSICIDEARKVVLDETTPAFYGDEPDTIPLAFVIANVMFSEVKKDIGERNLDYAGLIQSYHEAHKPEGSKKG